MLSGGGFTMIKMLGTLLVFFGFTSFGLLKGNKLKKDHSLTLDFIQSLSYVQREITQNQRSLSDILRTLKEKEYTVIGRYFNRIYESFEESNSFREKWEESMNSQGDFPRPLLQILQPLGDILGQYHSEKQGEAISLILGQLEELQQRQEEEVARLYKVYVVSGTAVGLFFVILFL